MSIRYDNGLSSGCLYSPSDLLEQVLTNHASSGASVDDNRCYVPFNAALRISRRVLWFISFFQFFAAVIIFLLIVTGQLRVQLLSHVLDEFGRIHFDDLEPWRCGGNC